MKSLWEIRKSSDKDLIMITRVALSELISRLSWIKDIHKDYKFIEKSKKYDHPMVRLYFNRIKSLEKPVKIGLELIKELEETINILDKVLYYIEMGKEPNIALLQTIRYEVYTIMGLVDKEKPLGMLWKKKYKKNKLGGDKEKLEGENND